MTLVRHHILVFLGCLLLAFLSYGGNSNHQLLHWDDITYISSNPWVTDISWQHLGELFTQFRLLNWHPLTWLSFIPEYYFCGNQAQCYATTNIVLHSINAFLLYLLAIAVLKRYQYAQERPRQQLTAAAIAALLFVVHPQHTESVIWIAERKDVLYSMFYLLALLSYIKHYHTKTDKSPFMPFIWFIFSLMSKSMAITLPVILILLDLFLLDRLRAASYTTWFRICVLEKMHYYSVAILIALITLLSQHVDTSIQPSLLSKGMDVTSALHHYIQSYFLPLNLSPFYPVASIKAAPDLLDLVFSFLLILTVIWSSRINSGRLFWSYFILTLLPVLGLLSFGEIAYADRYTYLTMIGFYILTGHLLAKLLFIEKYRYPVIIAIVGVILALSWNTRSYKNTWATDLSLWTYVANIYPKHAGKINTNLANSYFSLGQHDKAIEQYNQSIEINPHFVSAFYNLAHLQMGLGNIDNALKTYQRGIENNPDEPRLYVLAGDAFKKLGQRQLAFNYYATSIKVFPNYGQGQLRLGEYYFESGEYSKAIPFLEAILLDKALENKSRLLLAQVYLKAGMPNKAADMIKVLTAALGADHPAIIAMKKLVKEY